MIRKSSWIYSSMWPSLALIIFFSLPLKLLTTAHIVLCRIFSILFLVNVLMLWHLNGRMHRPFFPKWIINPWIRFEKDGGQNSFDQNLGKFVWHQLWVLKKIELIPVQWSWIIASQLFIFLIKFRKSFIKFVQRWKL